MERLKELGKRVKTERLAKGLSRKELAKKIRVSYGTIANIENAKGGNVAHLFRLGKYFSPKKPLLWIKKMFK